MRSRLSSEALQLPSHNASQSTPAIDIERGRFERLPEALWPTAERAPEGDSLVNSLAPLRDAVARWGGVDFRESLSRLAEKLDLLANTGRYGRLLSDLFASNDRSNLLALILEATFAHSFESRGKALSYEVKQHPDATTSIDFLRETAAGVKIYFELRLLQQSAGVQREVAQQLERHNRFVVSLGGEDEAQEVLRLQSALLGKVQTEDGRPVKFFATDRGTRNLVVVDITDLLLGSIDQSDCVLATYGDPPLSEPERRGVFGLLQEPNSSYPVHIQAAARRFSYFRGVVHAVLFLRRTPRSDDFDFELEYFLVPNYALLNQEEADILAAEIRDVLKVWRRAS